MSSPFIASARYDSSWIWYTVRTENFIIYYPQGHEQLAQRVLSLCEEVHRDITGFLGVEPEPCPIVLNPGTDIFNGYMNVFPSRISLHETPAYNVRDFGPGSDLLDHVFTHEYTHYAHITTRRGWYGELTRYVGEGLTISNTVSPGWIVEGVATNAETLFTDGGRGRSPLFRGEMMSFTEKQGLWSLNAASVSSPYAPPGGRIYLAGYFMVDFLERTYGKGSFARLGKYQAEHPLEGSGGAIRRVTGKSPGEFYQDFLGSFLAETRAMREKAQAAGLPDGRPVLEESSDLDDFVSHFWTEKGTIVGLRKGYDRKNALVEIDPGSMRKVSEIPAGTLTDLSAERLDDGRLLMAEVFYHPLGEGDLDSADLVIFDPGTREHKRLTKNQHIYSASLSPDGKTFAATRRNGMWIDLVLLDADGSNIRPLISRPGWYFAAPAWSPDGSRVAAVLKSGRNADIVLVNPADGSPELLYGSDAHEDYEPEFSPDGKWVVFSSDRSGIWNIYAWDLVGRKLHQLTSVPYAAGDPHLSPDGNTLSFSSMVRGVKQVRVMPFRPSEGKHIPLEESRQISMPDLNRLQPEPVFAGTKGIPRDAYKPFAHVPYISSDEEGAQAGMFIMGADPVGINSYTVNLLYGFRSGRPGYDINLTNKSWWPTLTARLYDTSVEGDTIGGGKSFWFRERGAELAAGLSPIIQAVPSVITSSFRIGPRLRYFSSLDDDVHLSGNENQSSAVFGEMKLSRQPDTAARDMVSSWGQEMFLSWEKAFSDLGGELPGYNGVISLTQYVPSCFEHQGLALTATHQAQKGLLFYDKDLSIPRGYSDDDPEGDLDRRKNLLLSAEYHFPILYMDDGLGLYLYHSNLLKGSVFVDYGAGWDGAFHWDSWNRKARTSVGGTLTNKCVLLAILPIEFGIQAGYKTHEKEGFVNFIVKAGL
jgi:WD40 repeat protein